MGTSAARAGRSASTSRGTSTRARSSARSQKQSRCCGPAARSASAAGASSRSSMRTRTPGQCVCAARRRPVAFASDCPRAVAVEHREATSRGVCPRMYRIGRLPPPARRGGPQRSRPFVHESFGRHPPTIHAGVRHDQPTPAARQSSHRFERATRGRCQARPRPGRRPRRRRPQHQLFIRK